jgi:hypothetical protein
MLNLRNKPRDYTGMFVRTMCSIPEESITMNEIEDIAVWIMQFLERIQNKVN